MYNSNDEILLSRRRLVLAKLLKEKESGVGWYQFSARTRTTHHIPGFKTCLVASREDAVDHFIHQAGSRQSTLKLNREWQSVPGARVRVLGIVLGSGRLRLVKLEKEDHVLWPD